MKRIIDEEIIINFQTRKDYCHCCDRDMENAKWSEMKQFELSTKNLLDNDNWEEYVKYEEDLPEMVSGYIFDTIEFHACHSGESLKFSKSETDKVIQFLLNNYKQ